MTDSDTLARLVDLEEIRDLARRYAHSVWTQNVDGAVGLFCEDGFMDVGDAEPVKGREKLRRAYENMIGDADLQPFVHNHVIDLDGDHATGTCYLDLRATVDGRSMIGSGYYSDVYQRTGEGWRFKSRKLTLKFFVPLELGWA
tara:strand:- start:353 stop:781 length:429 start_codon:yes stop_codon:yes gene_type:complete